MAAERNLSARTVTIGLSQYIEDLLHRYGVDNCEPAALPTSANNPHESPPLDSNMATHHRSCVGALLYASVATRLDITETVNRLC